MTETDRRRDPRRGPRILFFCGGTALRPLSRVLTAHTRSSLHLVTTFDSGGSSARLRAAFAMPAVGDIRNRLLALAAGKSAGSRALFELFSSRFPVEGRRLHLTRELDRMASGRHPQVAAAAPSPRGVVRRTLAAFRDRMPAGFDLRGASIGNLFLAGGYLESGRRLAPAIAAFSRLVNARGVVAPILDRNLHLTAELADGTVVCGQHRITGKQFPPLESPVSHLYLSASRQAPAPLRPPVGERARRLIARAGLICYPMGSFYSSLMANLLPAGVGGAVAAAGAPKVYVPGTGRDPEALGLSVADQVARLLSVLREDCGTHRPPGDLLDCVVVDRRRGDYPGGLDRAAIERQGVRVIDRPLVGNAGRIAGEKLVPLLVEMAPEAGCRAGLRASVRGRRSISVSSDRPGGHGNSGSHPPPERARLPG